MTTSRAFTRPWRIRERAPCAQIASASYMAGMKMSRMATWLPWTDRAGRLSWLKLVVFLGCLAPGLYMLAQIQFGWLSPKPVTDLIRECGDWVIRFIVFALAVTPIRHVIRWNKLVDVRRMLGLSAMFYAL